MRDRDKQKGKSKKAKGKKQESNLLETSIACAISLFAFYLFTYCCFVGVVAGDIR
jgi:hypothetical protein